MKKKYVRFKSLSKIVFILTFLLFQQTLLAQNEGKVWYFGTHAGLDFNTNPPSVLLDGQINTLEGSATISDENGQLLFYTDGISVYTKTHTLMPNSADGLGGHSSSAQSAVIVPHPSNPNLFYIFTVSAYVNSNVFYSIVDMSLNNGLGDVLEDAKVIPVLVGTGEYIQATPSADGSFWWVVLHKSGSSDYYAYRLTSAGFDLENPVISTTGTPSPANGDIGFIKFNNLGTRIVRTSYIANHFNVSDFDNATGIVSNSLHFPLYAAYGAEFSPNNRFLYISAFSSMGLKQYDLNAGNTVSLIQATVHTYNNLATGSLQIAPDGKIYSSRYGAFALDVIHAPNNQGASANFQLNGQTLGGASAQLGLPNIIATLVSQTPPAIDQLAVSEITSESALLEARVTSDGGAAISERGFYFGTEPNPTSNMTLVSGTTGVFTLPVSELEPNTLYFFNAFASNTHGTTHITGGSFTTSEEVDTEPPVAICMEEITIHLDENGMAFITTEMIDNGSYDNVAIESISLDKYDFNCADLGENLVTMTVTDTSGNSSTCQVIVLVEDSMAPLVICFDITVSLDSEGLAFLSPEFLGFETFDNCEITHTQLDIDTFDCSNIDIPTLVTFTAFDSSGNSTSCSFYVNVIDDLGPEIIGITDQFVDLPPSPLNFILPDFFAEGIISATDNCTFPVTNFFQSPPPGTVLGEGIHIISVIARDDLGNSTLNTFKIFIDSQLSNGEETDISSISLYPNPASQMIHISNPGLHEIEGVFIYDMLGRLVQSVSNRLVADYRNIDISALAVASYVVVIKGNNSQTVKRLIVK
jgi:hypothetical protein